MQLTLKRIGVSILILGGNCQLGVVMHYQGPIQILFASQFFKHLSLVKYNRTKRCSTKYFQGEPLESSSDWEVVSG